MTPELKPCPFCGSTDVYADRNTEETFLIQCGSCFSEGPETGSATAAWEAWDRRASPWQPIETAPTRRVILFFGITCRREDGSASNWKMATGVRYKNEGDDGDDIFEWEGRKLKTWEIKPTHWLELPEPPEVE